MVNLSERNQNILEALIAREKAGTLDRASFDAIPIEVYHHPLCPGVSSTRIKAIVERNYNYAQGLHIQQSPALAFGNAFHAYIQGLDVFLMEYSVGKYADGKKFISYMDLDRLEAMARNVRLHPEVMELFEGASQEHTFFARCPYTGVLRKARPDVLKGTQFGDWKTCENASATAFARDCRKYLYRISARFYMDVVSEATGVTMTDFFFIPVEKVDLYNVAFYPVAQASLDQAKLEIDQALSALARAKEGGWTGYPLAQSPLLI